MEVRDYVGALGRRLWILILVPVLAVGAAGFLRWRDPLPYRAHVTITLALPTRSTSQISVVNQLVANFEGAIRSQAIQAATEEATGVRRKLLRDGLTSEQIGTSNVIELSLTGPNPETVDDALAFAGEAALAQLGTSTLAPAQGELAAAQETFGASQDALQEYLRSIDFADPNVAFAQRAAALADLREARTEARDAGNTAEVERLNGQIETASRSLAQDRVRWQSLRANSDGAESALNEANIDFAAARGLNDALISSPVTVLETVQIPRIRYMSQTLVMVGAVAFALAAAFVLLLELLFPWRRGQASRAAALATPASEARPSIQGPATGRDPEGWAVPGSGFRRATGARPDHLEAPEPAGSTAGERPRVRQVAESASLREYPTVPGGAGRGGEARD